MPKKPEIEVPNNQPGEQSTTREKQVPQREAAGSDRPIEKGVSKPVRPEVQNPLMHESY